MSDPGGTSYLRPDKSGPAQPQPDRFGYHNSALSCGLLSSVVIGVFPASRHIAVLFGERRVLSARFKGETGVAGSAQTTRGKEDEFSASSTANSSPCLTSLKQHHRRNYDERATFNMNATQAGCYTLRTKRMSSALVCRGVCDLHYVMNTFTNLLNIAAQ